jgi:hypothetical protein
VRKKKEKSVPSIYGEISTVARHVVPEIFVLSFFWSAPETRREDKRE